MNVLGAWRKNCFFNATNVGDTDCADIRPGYCPPIHAARFEDGPRPPPKLTNSGPAGNEGVEAALRKLVYCRLTANAADGLCLEAIREHVETKAGNLRADTPTGDLVAYLQKTHVRSRAEVA